MPKETPTITTQLQCLQVWGGTEAADQALKMTGLDGYLYARPHQGAKRGGDVYYVSSCAAGRITRVLLADVAGHGSKVAETAQDLRSLMQHYVNFVNQQRFMKELNRRFSEISDLGRFATTVALSFYAPANRLSLSNAGHPAPMLYRAREKRWSVVGVDPSDETSDASADLPLGVEGDAGYQQTDLTFSPGDLLLLYTDALIESRGADARMLGVSGLLDRLSRLDVREPAKLVPKLIDLLTQEDKNDLTDDDVTVLLIQANGKRSEWRKLALSPIIAMRGLLKGVPLSLTTR